MYLQEVNKEDMVKLGVWEIGELQVITFIWTTTKPTGCYCCLYTCTRLFCISDPSDTGKYGKAGFVFTTQ